jgi:hypothetical protein
MSEYQYYDFRAIDRPLTSSQGAELGKISTRAEISSTSFSTRVRAAAWFRVRGTHVVVGFLSDDEEESWESDGEGELASIVPVRSDLLTGGVRVLYLGWLLRVQAGEVADDVTEPEVPAGLARLSGGEAALVEFLRRM